MKERMFEIGDILLFPSETFHDIEDYVKEVLGEEVTSVIRKLLGYKYCHAEIYLGNGYVLAAWTNGVKLYKLPLKLLKEVHVFRKQLPLMPEEKQKLLNLVPKYWNLPYDFTSYILNAYYYLFEKLTMIFPLPDLLADFKTKYENKQEMICSELVARMYKEIGYPIETTEEFTTPDDIGNSKMFVRIF